MKFDLKTLRERKGYSQAELASAMNTKWADSHPDDASHFTTDMIVRMEKAPDNISLEVLYIITQVFGVTFDQLLHPVIPRLAAPAVEDNWGAVELIREKLLAEVERLNAMAETKEQKSAAEQLRDYTHRVACKTRIACIGRPDSGKSRTLNTLLGKDILPTNWTPTTSTYIILKHIDDRPDFFGNDTVWVFKDMDGSFWYPDMINDAEYCRQWRCDSGSYELITTYGSHDAADKRESSEEIGAIVVFVDSPVLRCCDLIDLPGFNPQAVITDAETTGISSIYDSRDSMLSARASGMADGFIYLSIANSFLYGDDISMLQMIVKSLPMIEDNCGSLSLEPFANLFIVASQALTVDRGSTESLDRILDSAAKRLWTMVKDHPCITERIEKYGEERTYRAFRSRFFTSEMDNQSLTERFHSSISDFFGTLPLIQAEKIMLQLRSFCDTQRAHFEAVAERCKMLCAELTQVEKTLSLIESREAERSAEFRRFTRSTRDTINSMKADSAAECRRIFSSVICASHIAQVIDEHELKKNKRDMQELVSLLNAELENKLSAHLTAQSKILSQRINDYLENCQQSFDGIATAGGQIDSLPLVFNVSRAFAGGLSGLATFGALAAWAASYGSLGGYILVAKAVSFLASIGIHLGGTAAVISAVSAIGGPVVLGIAIALITGLTSILLLGGTWKKLVGNKLVKQYQSKGVLDSLLEVSDRFWDETLVAFDAGTDRIEADWYAQLKEYRKIAKANDPDAVAADAGSAQRVARFFGRLCDSIENSRK